YQVITYRESRLGGLGIEKQPLFQNPQVCPTHGEADSADENAVAKALPLLQNKCAEYPLE
ncbi:14680_t:CDS:2, partial [Rhizophagus irregularis]